MEGERMRSELTGLGSEEGGKEGEGGKEHAGEAKVERKQEGGKQRANRRKKES